VRTSLPAFRRRVGGFIGGFEAGLASRRLKGFQPSRAHLNTLIAAAGPDITARARWLIRNNGYATNAIESWAGNVVGAGIKPSLLISNPALKASIGSTGRTRPTPRDSPTSTVCNAARRGKYSSRANSARVPPPHRGLPARRDRLELCRQVWTRWMDTAVLAGALDLPDYDKRRRQYLACDGLPPKWDWIDPLKDGRAENQTNRCRP
jgi:capsid protein